MKNLLKLYQDGRFNRAINCVLSENDKTKEIKVFIFSNAMKYFIVSILDTLKTFPKMFFLILNLMYLHPISYFIKYADNVLCICSSLKK